MPSGINFQLIDSPHQAAYLSNAVQVKEATSLPTYSQSGTNKEMGQEVRGQNQEQEEIKNKEKVELELGYCFDG